MKRLFLALIFSSLLLNGFATSYSGSSEGDATIIRVPVWVFLETVPGSKTQAAKDSLPPRAALTELSAYILSGMTYGWTFSYTPYDKKRNVSEVFEFAPVHSIQADDNALKIKELKADYPYLYSWAEYAIPAPVAKRREFWKSISYKTAQGRGEAERDQEIYGVYEAYTNAAKSAVRNYARTLTKNKPSEVIGEMLIKDSPRLFMKSGKFYAELEVYINIKEIIPYKYF